MLDPGKMRQRVTLQRDHLTDAAGVEKRTPENYATPWAAVEYLSGSEAMRAKQVDASVNVKVTLRYRTDVKAQDRVIYRGRTMQIKVVIPDEAERVSLTLHCESND